MQRNEYQYGIREYLLYCVVTFVLNFILAR